MRLWAFTKQQAADEATWMGYTLWYWKRASRNFRRWWGEERGLSLKKRVLLQSLLHPHQHHVSCWNSFQFVTYKSGSWLSFSTPWWAWHYGKHLQFQRDRHVRCAENSGLCWHFIIKRPWTRDEWSQLQQEILNLHFLLYFSFKWYVAFPGFTPN